MPAERGRGRENYMALTPLFPWKWNLISVSLCRAEIATITLILDTEIKWNENVSYFVCVNIKHLQLRWLSFSREKRGRNKTLAREFFGMPWVSGISNYILQIFAKSVRLQNSRGPQFQEAANERIYVYRKENKLNSISTERKLGFSRHFICIGTNAITGYLFGTPLQLK